MWSAQEPLILVVALLSPPVFCWAFSPQHQLTPRRHSTELGIGQLFSDLFPKTETIPSISPERVQEAKDNIRDLARGTSNGVTASEEIQSEISALVLEIEAGNPTPDLSTSPKLDGSWKLVYTTNGGSSAGKLGPFVGEVEQLIRTEGREESPDYINYVRLFGGAVEGALTATWDVLADDKWQVNFESVAFRLLGIPLVQKDLTAEGIWRMSYLDDDFRILYAMGGKNVLKENIYILAK